MSTTTTSEGSSLPTFVSSNIVQPELHLYCKDTDPEDEEELVRHLKSQKLLLFSKLNEYASDRTVLRRFLTAREGDVAKAAKLMTQALEWRARRQPEIHDYAELEKEARTGKVRVSGKDRFGRPVVVLDSTVQNTEDREAHVRFLAFNLEHALRMAQAPVEKYVIFMHLTDFSLANNPSWSMIKEVCAMLVSCFCECCGHVVVYGAPRVFSIVFAAVKPLIDPTTATKIIFANDRNNEILEDVIGPNWRLLSGVGYNRESPDSSPGYIHKENWLHTLAVERDWRRTHGNRGPLRHVLVNWPGPDHLSLDPTRAFKGLQPIPSTDYLYSHKLVKDVVADDRGDSPSRRRQEDSSGGRERDDTNGSSHHEIPRTPNTSQRRRQQQPVVNSPRTSPRTSPRMSPSSDAGTEDDSTEKILNLPAQHVVTALVFFASFYFFYSYDFFFDEHLASSAIGVHHNAMFSSR